MKKNKAFTLIELLAVIIILAIIALIATPIIINVVEDARKEGFKQTALGYYKAAEYIYDEMFLDGKVEDISFTFEDGKQTSSNSDYQLQLKGEVPQGGLVYLTKEGHIAVSINNSKYCAYVDDGKTVTIHEDINHCGYTPVPEGCYVLEHGQLYDYTNGQLDGSEEWMTQEYNMLKYKSLSTNDCPKEFNILLIPSEIDGQKVEGIKRFANRTTQNISAEHVIIPSGVKVIDYQAFSYKNVQTKMTHVTLPDGLIYIGLYAFKNRSLTNIDIPNSVLSIGNGAFRNNYITNITLSEHLTNIGDTAFCDNQLTNIIIPNSVQKIGSSAFRDNQLTSVTIPSGVTSIKEMAFCSNRLTNVVIPNGVTDIEKAAFQDNQLTSLSIPNSIAHILENAFANNQLTSLTIPSSVTTIENNAFNNNQFPNKAAITIEGDSTRFDSNWTSIGFPE